MDFDAFDENDNKNKFATYEQINDRQAGELRDLLTRWENGAVTPWHAMLELSTIVGTRCSFLIGYQLDLQYGPGTKYFESEISGHPHKVRDRLNNVGQFSQNRATSSLEWIERLKRNDGPLRQEVFQKLLSEATERTTQSLAIEPALGKRLKINDDIQGPQGFVDALQKLIRERDAAIAAGDRLFEAICEATAITIRLERKQAEYDAEHMEEAVKRQRAKLEQEHERMLAHLKENFRPEALDPQQHADVIVKNIRDIRFSLDIGDFNSWTAAEAMAEVLLRAPVTNSENEALTDFKEALAGEKRSAEARKTDAEETVDRFRPLTESDVKAPLAQKFALERAHKSQRLEQIEKYKAAHGGKEPDKDEIRYFYYKDVEIPEDVAYQANIDYPDRTLCNEIHISPSGTGLIRIYHETDPVRRQEAKYEGTKVARITTYSISFVPKTADDLELLKDTLAKALTVLGDIEYAYDLEGGYVCPGEPYKRVTGSKIIYGQGEVIASSYIKLADGRATPEALFDLDDLQILYYLMEPVIEPSAQIAAAMNAARYAEERGAILTPKRIDFEDTGHEVADRLGFLRDKETPDLLAEAVRDALVMRALNKTDDAGLIASVMTLAAHTLTGQIADIHGAFPTFDKLLEDRSQNPGQSVIAYDEALSERTRNLMRSMVGLPKDSDISTGDALNLLLSRISSPLQKKYRSQDKAETIAVRAAWERQRAEFDRRLREGYDPFQNIADAKDEAELAIKISDNIAGHAGRTKEERNEAYKNALSKPTGLILAASAVEPALDGLHAGGRYRTRTKGSPLVRYELPDALQRFNPEGRYQPSRFMIAAFKL